MVDSGTIVRRVQAEGSSQLIRLITSSVLLVILARQLNPNGYGSLFLALSVVQTARILSEAGIAKSAARYVAEYRVKNPEYIPNIIGFSLLLLTVTISSVSLALFATSEIISSFLGGPNLTSFLKIGSIVLVGLTLTDYVRNLFQGSERIDLAAFTNAVHGVLRTFSAGALALFGFSATIVFTGYALAATLSGLIGMGLLYFLVYRPNTTGQAGKSVPYSLYQRIAEYALPLIATRGAHQLDRQVDTLLVGWILGPISVSFYVLSKQIIEAVEKPASIIGFSIAPTLGTDMARGDTESAANLYEKSIKNILVLYFPGALGLILVAEPFLGIVFGSEYTEAKPVLQVLAIYVVLQSITYITSRSLDYVGRAKERAYAKGGTSIANAILNLLIIPIMGVVGAAIATVFTHSIYVAINLVIVNSELPIDWPSILSDSKKIFFICIIMGPVVRGAQIMIPGIPGLVASILSGAILWAILGSFLGLINMSEMLRAFNPSSRI